MRDNVIANNLKLSERHTGHYMATLDQRDLSLKLSKHGDASIVMPADIVQRPNCRVCHLHEFSIFKT